MSLITDDPENSPRDCSRNRQHYHNHGSIRGRKRAWIAASSAVASLVSLAVILWLTLLRPFSPPDFSLLAATVSLTNNGSVMVIDAAFTARNPSAHAAVLYNDLQASASYAGMHLRATLAPVEQPADGEVEMSALLKSSSPWTAAAGTKPAAALLKTRIEGQLRWKVTNWWVSVGHDLAVDCVAVGVPSGGVVHSQCATNVLS